MSGILPSISLIQPTISSELHAGYKTATSIKSSLGAIDWEIEVFPRDSNAKAKLKH